MERELVAGRGQLQGIGCRQVQGRGKGDGRMLSSAVTRLICVNPTLASHAR